MTKRIVLVLKSGGDFAFSDVRLISDHIIKKWVSEEKPEIICFWDKAFMEFTIDHIHIKPLPIDSPGWWSRIFLYSPMVADLLPFLYIDLDTAVIQSLEHIFDVVKSYESKWVTLDDFWQPGLLATGLVWFPKNNPKFDLVWKKWNEAGFVERKGRMDAFLRSVTTADLFWQKIIPNILDFKPKYAQSKFLTGLPFDANLVCFHGKPRIPQAAFIPWVDKYIKEVE